jgi:hypothetical protein
MAKQELACNTPYTPDPLRLQVIRPILRDYGRSEVFGLISAWSGTQVRVTWMRHAHGSW